MTVVSPPYQLFINIIPRHDVLLFLSYGEDLLLPAVGGLNVFSGLALIIISEALPIFKLIRQRESPEQ